MFLTAEERELAKYYDFDPKILEIIKKKTGSGFQEIVLEQIKNIQATEEWFYEQSDSEFQSDYKQYLLDLKKQFPELGALVSIEINRIDNPKSPDILEQVHLNTRREKIALKYRAKFVQHLNKIKASPDAMREWHDLEMTWSRIKDDQDFEKALQETVQQIELDEKFKPQIGFLFSIPVDEYLVAQMRAFGQNLVTNTPPEDQDRYDSINDDAKTKVAVMPALHLDNTRRAVDELNEQTEPLGYTVIGVASLKIHGYFFKYSTALKFAQEMSNPLSHFEITDTLNVSNEVEFDPNTFTPNSSDFSPINLQPFTRIEKLNGNKWKVIPCKTYQVDIIETRAVVQKMKASAKKTDKYNILFAAETNGINYAVDTEIIVDKLQKWDELYGIKLIEAQFDSFTIKFDSLPADLSYLCTEMWLFCPDLCEMDHDDYEHNAVVMKDFARKLKDSKTVSFWWD